MKWFHKPHIGYKKCIIDTEMVIVKVDVRGDNDEDRYVIKDINYARYSCGKVKVLDIYNPESGEHFKRASSIHNDNLMFTVGKVCKEGEISGILGIYYYLTEDAARWERATIDLNDMVDNLRTIRDCGVEMTYRRSGQLMRKRTFEGGVLCEFASYHYDGSVDELFECKDGKYHGDYEKYFICPDKIKIKCSYVEGKLHGDYVKYYRPDRVELKCTYVEGKLHGKYVKYFTDSDKVREKRIYRNGKKIKSLIKHHIGYKKCRDGKIVKLAIMGKNNEGREWVVDPKFAKFRCSKAGVLDIYDPKTKESFFQASSIRNADFIYSNGYIHECEYKYDDYINEVCTSGIHYYLNEEAAIGYDDNKGQVVFHNGKTRFHYYSNGQIEIKYTIKKGKMHGKFVRFDGCGKLISESYYENNKLLWRNKLENGKWVCTMNNKNDFFI